MSKIEQIFLQAALNTISVNYRLKINAELNLSWVVGPMVLIEVNRTRIKVRDILSGGKHG